MPPKRRKPKGHKHDKLRLLRLADIEQKLQDMPAKVAEYRVCFAIRDRSCCATRAVRAVCHVIAGGSAAKDWARPEDSCLWVAAWVIAHRSTFAEFRKLTLQS